MPGDGDPIPMSELTLGPRYGSEDMYRDMGIVPGSRVAFEKDGIVYTDVVQEVRYTSPTVAIWPQLSLWQRIVRRLTPKRFLKPLQPIREAEPGGVTILTGQHGADVMARQRKAMEQAGEFIDGLISNKPDTSGSVDV